MKIIVDSDQTHVVIPVLNGLIDSAMTRSLITKGLEECGHEIKLDPKFLDVFLSELAKSAKKYKGLEILRVEMSSGKRIRVVL